MAHLPNVAWRGGEATFTARARFARDDTTGGEIVEIISVGRFAATPLFQPPTTSAYLQRFRRLGRGESRGSFLDRF